MRGTLFGFSFLFATAFVVAPLGKEQQAALLDVSSRYASLMTDISKCGSAKEGDIKRNQLRQVYTSSYDFVNNKHVNDLFRGESNLSLDEYITCLEENYNYGVRVDYKLLEISDCMETVGGKSRGYVKFNKKMSYGGEEKSYEEIVAIEVNGGEYKVVEVFFPADYNKNGACNMNSPPSMADNLFNNYEQNGDAAFSKGDYIKAKEMYERALSYRQDSRVNSRISECNKLIDLAALKAKAESYMRSQDYSYAKDMWQKVLNRFPNESSLAKSKIDECDRLQKEKQYKQYIREADALFNSYFFQQASGAYQQALYIKPGDNYAQQRMYECKMKDASYIRSRINEAIRLAENNNKLKEAFEILYLVEPSGQLGAQNYYFMAMMMDGREQRVDKYMDFTVNQCDHLAVVYCKQAMRMGSSKAENMWDNIFTNQTRNK